VYSAEHCRNSCLDRKGECWGKKKDPEAAFQHAEDSFDDISRRCMTQIEQFLLVGRSGMLFNMQGKKKKPLPDIGAAPFS
jgi:hypothetical protein